MAMYKAFEGPRSVLLEGWQLRIQQELKALQELNVNCEGEGSSTSCSMSFDSLSEKQRQQHMANISSYIKEFGMNLYFPRGTTNPLIKSNLDDLWIRSRTILAYEKPSRRCYLCHERAVVSHVDGDLQEALLGPHDDRRLLYKSSPIENMIRDSLSYGPFRILWVSTS